MRHPGTVTGAQYSIQCTAGPVDNARTRAWGHQAQSGPNPQHSSSVQLRARFQPDSRTQVHTRRVGLDPLASAQDAQHLHVLVKRDHIGPLAHGQQATIVQAHGTGRSE